MTSPMFRVGCFDIEASNLNADFGIVLCVSIKENGVSKPITVRIDDSPQYKKRPWDDTWLCGQVRELMSEFDLLVGWNSARFDWPFLNTRLTFNGYDPLAKRLHKDLLYTSRFGLALHSNRLASVQEFFGLVHSKTSIDGSLWTKALTGDRESMDYIVKHCELDVLVLEEILGKLKHLIKEIKA